jgi:hypothetical protein
VATLCLCASDQRRLEELLKNFDSDSDSIIELKQGDSLQQYPLALLRHYINGENRIKPSFFCLDLFK